MKKLFYSLFALALTAMTFTSCEDVPAPYFDPVPGSSDSGSDVIPSGTGTVDNPFNVAAANKYIEDGGNADAIVYVKGIISSIKSIDTGSYGNAEYYISDDGTAAGQLLVYRGYSLNNKKFTSESEIKAGDEVIVCGKLVLYNSTKEFTQGNYIYQLNGEGGNGGGTASGSGTLDDPYNPAGASAFASTLAAGAESDNEVYIKGKISRIANNGTFEGGGNYGNATFYISEDGTEDGEFYIFRTLYLGNVKYTDYTGTKVDIKVGDEVVIYGKVTNYQGNTPETVAGKSYLYSLNGNTGNSGGGTSGGANGEGTLEKPYTATGAINAVKDLTWTSNTEYQSTDNVYVKGKISRIANNGTFTAGGNYGNASFYISDDGTESNEFYCFRILYLDNTKFNEYTGEKVDIKVGDEVVIYGKLMNYRGNTPETVSGAAYLYSLNASGGSGGSGGSGDGAMTKSVDADNAIVTFTANGTTASSNVVEYDLTTSSLAHQTENPSLTINGVTFTFAANGGGTTPKYWKSGDFNEFRMYAKNKLTITPSSGKIHSIKLQCSPNYQSTKYTGNEQAAATISGNAADIVNEWTGTTGGTQLRIKKVTITYAQ